MKKLTEKLSQVSERKSYRKEQLEEIIDLGGPIAIKVRGFSEETHWLDISDKEADQLLKLLE
jgi:hypothetical protein